MRYRVLIGALIIMAVGAVWAPGVSAQCEKADYIRLHVIAHSDRETDQAVKHRVRDAILDAYGDTFACKQDMIQAEQTVRTHLDTINRIARKTLLDNGMDYGASSEYGLFSFPTRQYGDSVLLAGEYRALRVVLGDGAGANWWCVLFPPLCVHDTSAHDEDEESAKDTEIEDETDTEAPPEDAEESPPPEKEKKDRPQIKFKIVEWIKGIFNK